MIIIPRTKQGYIVCAILSIIILIIGLILISLGGSFIGAGFGVMAGAVTPWVFYFIACWMEDSF